MASKKFLKGSQLFAVARKKGVALGLEGNGLKLEELILSIQEKEGHTPCYRKRESCTESQCCWQASCGAI